nr:hypothetical protein [Salinispora arenicola]
MAGAVDLDFVKPKGATEATSRVPESTGTAGSVAPVRASIATSDDASIQLNESPSIGKVYFTDPAGNQYSCSASTVASGKRRAGRDYRGDAPPCWLVLLVVGWWPRGRG